MQKSISILFLLNILIINILYSQTFLKGTVLDSKTKTPLPFSTIIINNDSHRGDITNMDGQFEIPIYKNDTIIRISFVGYDNKVILISKLNKSNNIILLSKKTYFLNEVTVYPGINPAHRIINEAIKHKKINNPDNYNSYSCKIYSKTSFDLSPNAKHLEDSLYNEYKKLADSTHILLMETISKRNYSYPKNTKEKIEGIKVSGFKNSPFTIRGTDFQPFHFYDDYINIYQKTFLNPISKGSTKKYLFFLTDTIFYPNDTLFIIDFKPRQTSNINGLQGRISINSNKYAIEYISAIPFDKGLYSINFYQKYIFTETQKWFPSELNIEILFEEYPNKEMGMFLKNNTHITEINLKPNFDEIKFNEKVVEINERANQMDSSFWSKYRHQPLGKKDKTSYHIIDSIGEKYKFDKKFNILGELVKNGKIPISCINVGSFLKVNKFEKYRPGISIHTNDRLSKFFSIGGYTGYGTKDKKWKYNGDLKFNISKKNEASLSFHYKNNVKPPGYNNTEFDVKDIFYEYMISRMDYFKGYYSNINFRLKYLKTKISLKKEQISPGYMYQFQTNNGLIDHFNFSEVSIKLKYAYKEALVPFFGTYFSLGTKYPTFYLTYTKGVNNILDGAYDYHKFSFSFSKDFILRNIGTSSICLRTGFMSKGIPYQKIFVLEGSNEKNVPVYIKNTFQSVGLHDYISDKFVHIFYSHNFGTLLLKNKFMQPEIFVIQNIGFGKISNLNAHQNIELNSYEKGIYESGILINNLIKFNYIDIVYFGFGGGIFYQYGTYAYDKTASNFTYKFSGKLSF